MTVMDEDDRCSEDEEEDEEEDEDEDEDECEKNEDEEGGLCVRARVCVCVCVYVCYVVFDNIVYDAGIRAWASLRIRDPYNDVGKSRSLIWVPAIVFFYIIFVQPATGIVLHGWAYYLWLGGHYVAGVTLVI